jgi:hypothetical protein
MSELTETKEEYKALPPAELLEGIAENMRVYDALVVERNAMRDLLAQDSDLFDELDIELEAVPYQAPELAYKALGYVISRNKLEAVEKDIKGLESSAIFAEMAMRLGGLYKKRYEITSLDPNDKIGGFYASDSSSRLLNYAGKSYSKRKGRVQSVNLSPQSGGFINLMGRSGIIYQAGPLINRDNDYKPVFEIKDLSAN